MKSTRFAIPILFLCLLLFIVGIITYSETLEVDISSGRTRTSVSIFHVTIKQRINDTPFSLIAERCNAIRNPPNWKVDTMNQFGVFISYRYHGTANALGQICWCLDLYSISAEYQEKIVKFTLLLLGNNDVRLWIVSRISPPYHTDPKKEIETFIDTLDFSKLAPENYVINGDIQKTE